MSWKLVVTSLEQVMQRSIREQGSICLPTTPPNMEQQDHQHEVEVEVEQGLTSHQTHYKSYRGHQHDHQVIDCVQTNCDSGSNLRS